MSEITKLLNDLQNLAKLQRQFAIESIEKKEGLISELVVRQMESGIDGTGNPIRPEYTPKYAKFKGFSTPNLKRTGAFHRSVFADAVSDGIETGATDEKTGKLEAKYTKNILSLTERSIDVITESVLPDIQLRNEKFLKI